MNGSTCSKEVEVFGLRRAHQVTILGGAVLLTILAVGLLARSSTAPAADAAPSRSPATYVSPAIFTVFLVNSEAEAQALKEREAQLAREREIEGVRRRWSFEVLIAGDAVEEFIVLNEVRETQLRWQRTGASGLEVVDLR